MKEPYSAWTAIGTTGLVPDNGIVEIQVIAHLKGKVHWVPSSHTF